jgi:hypothetical protein
VDVGDDVQVVVYDVGAGRAACVEVAAMVVAAYDSAFTRETHVHASDKDLQRGHAAPTRIHKIV